MQIGEDSEKDAEMKNPTKVTIKVTNEHYCKNESENYWVFLMILRNGIFRPFWLGM